MKFAKWFMLLVFLTASFVANGEPLATFQEIAGSPFPSGLIPNSVAYSPIALGNLFAAVPSGADQTVSVYEVNQTTGLLTQVADSPFPTGFFPNDVAFSPIVSGNLFAAVANLIDNTVSVYQVDQATGVFVEILGSPFSTGAGPYSVEYSPVVLGNLFSAITNSFDNTVSVFLVDQMTGAFSEVAGSPFATGVQPFTVAFSPVVQGILFAAITNLFEDTVSVYSVNQTSGVFTEITDSPFATGAQPWGMAYSPVVLGNLFAANTNVNENTITVFAVDQSTGALTPIPTSPFLTDSGPVQIAFSPVVSGQLFAAVTNSNSNNVSIYGVDQVTGIFTEFIDSPFATGEGPDGLSFSPVLSGKLFVAVANKLSSNLSVFELVPIQPPANTQGCQIKDGFATQTIIINRITWSAPRSGPVPVSYYIFENAELTKLVAIIPANQKLEFLIPNRCEKTIYTYYIISVDQNNNFSSPKSIIIRNKCECKEKVGMS